MNSAKLENIKSLCKKKEVSFLYTNGKQSQKEIRVTILFRIVSKKNKILKNKAK